jgi:RsiW-degrading membrane proteinase PrsW (M82 family)
VLAVFGALGVLVDRVILPRQPPEARARWLVQSGRLGEAETLYWRRLHAGPVTPQLLVAFLDVHAAAPMARMLEAIRNERDGRAGFEAATAPPVEEWAIDELLARPDLPADTALLGRFWRAALEQNDAAGHGAAARSADAQEPRPTHARDPDDERAVVAAADREPPLPWANHLLAREAERRGDHERAVRRYLREATHVPENREDADMALGWLVEAGAWDDAAALLDDPETMRVAPAWVKFRVAVERRDAWRAARWSFPAAFQRPDAAVLALTIAAAAAWLVICARLGNVRERPFVKLPLYLAALALGVLSIYPTMVLLALQESVLHLTESRDGDMARDALYFFFGVGFREELSKLLLFLPLYPLVRRFGARIDVVVCGGLVGLGFAAAENLNYFAHGNLATATARYMTANFAHIAWTALAAAALDDMVKDGDKHSFDFSRTLVSVMAMHGAYDLFLSTSIDGLSFFSMALFIALGRMFLARIHEAHPRVGRGLPVLDVFAVCTAAVVGSTFVYACSRVGPSAAATVMFEGLLGTFIFTYFFVQEFRRV